MSDTRANIIEALEARTWPFDRGAIEPFVSTPRRGFTTIVILATALANAYDLGQGDAKG